MNVNPSKCTSHASFAGEFLSAAKQAPTIFFAPILGAIKGVSGQWRDMHRATLTAAGKAD